MTSPKVNFKIEEVLLFESSKDHYEADACVVWCFDDRFTGLYTSFLKDRKFNHVDLVKVAGGAKDLLSRGEGDFVLNQIGLSIKLHKTKLVVLELHIDCGGFGGSATFSNDREVEFQNHADVLKNARDFVRNAFPSVQVECYIADFDGLYEIS